MPASSVVASTLVVVAVGALVSRRGRLGAAAGWILTGGMAGHAFLSEWRQGLVLLGGAALLSGWVLALRAPDARVGPAPGLAAAGLALAVGAVTPFALDPMTRRVAYGLAAVLLAGAVVTWLVGLRRRRTASQAPAR